MREAFEFIFELINQDIIRPIFEALETSSILDFIIEFINSILTYLFYAFKDNVEPNSIINFINNDLIANIIGIIFLILSFILFYKIVAFGFDTCSKLMKSMLLSNENIKGRKAWRKQWSRK